MSAAAVSPAREDSEGPAATKPSRRRTHTIVVGLTVLAAALALRYSASMPARVDEPYHVKQIEVFYRGDCRMYVPPGGVYPFLAMLPGYHAVVAAIARLLEVRTFSELRLIHFGLSLLLLPAAYFTARAALGREQAWLRALQCFCCPPIFALCFVVYTDVFALTVPLASLACCLGGRFAAGGLLGLAAAAMLLTVAAAGFDRATLAFLTLTWLGTTLPLALVEPRYYLPTYALLVLLRPPDSTRHELTQWAYFLTLGLALHAIHVHGRYFL
ncbi:MAG: hypothetical protein J0M17_17320 [Planctomycetes bacterium]|nr:hypothetical protein [Planctomycetota bacterium]